MSADEIYQELAASIRKLSQEGERSAQQLAEFRIVIDTLLQILRARESLNDGHLKVLDKLRERVRAVSELKVELNSSPDKHAEVNSEVDCGARMHLCHGRCCSFNVKLSEQDLREGQLAWRIHEPYYLAQTPQGYCVYQTVETGFCGNYQHRPAPCRTYDCKEDRRIWEDFDKMIPAPMPDGLITIRRNPKAAG